MQPSESSWTLRITRRNSSEAKRLRWVLSTLMPISLSIEMIFLVLTSAPTERPSSLVSQGLRPLSTFGRLLQVRGSVSSDFRRVLVVFLPALSPHAVAMSPLLTYPTITELAYTISKGRRTFSPQMVLPTAFLTSSGLSVLKTFVSRR